MGEHGGDLPQGHAPDDGVPVKKHRTCPDCGSVETRLSKQGGIVVTLFSMLNMSRYKCKVCGRRFFAGN